MKFAADAPLGKLSKWLRIMGYDCAYPAVLEDQDPDDDRIFLTRTTGVKGKGVLFIGCNYIEDQIDTLNTLLPIKDNIKPFTRCTLCNTPLKTIEKESVFTDVPDYIYVTHDDFQICPSCKRVYWRGTHRERMEGIIEALFVRKPNPKS
ncbi:MAG: Mut7-C RNAse domain-containing protein [Deltaproteobacteria bacterium]|uniref:Mut7-C RNAse domain-containing protein n=1 Tax=Candidatus Zymogenus saltonus TaxID=2844893 RepID=A0A9D8K9C7_9DELT|nr:Mut7-C RNAse domain-containing protein [Candidatus Zymogenus saltonus]